MHDSDSIRFTCNVTVYAAEGENTEEGFQPAEEGTVQSADTEQTQETASEQTEEKDPEENGLDSFIYIREKEDKTTGKAKVKKVTIEELKEEIDAEQEPELAAVVFQFSDEEFETEALTENTIEIDFVLYKYEIKRNQVMYNEKA